MAFRNYILFCLPVFLISLIVVSSCYSWELADLAKGDTQTMTMPILHEGEQFMFTYKYKYSTGPDPVFAGPIVYQFDMATGNIIKLEANDRRGIKVILKVEALTAELIRSGKEKFVARAEEAQANEARENAEKVNLLGQTSDSATVTDQNNNPIQVPTNRFATTDSAALNNGSLVGGYTTATEGPLPDGEAIYKSRATARAVKEGIIKAKDVKREDKKALSHKVVKNDDGSVTVTVVVPDNTEKTIQSGGRITSSTNLANKLIKELALNPRQYTGDGNSLSSATMRLHLGGPMTNELNKKTGNRTVTKTYFVTRQ